MNSSASEKDKTMQKHNLRMSGQGEQVLLFAHGFGCDQHVWRHVTPGFENENQIAVFDYIGAGKSDLNAYNPVKYNKLKGYADDVLAVRNALDAKDVVFIGHSVSGMIGLLAGIEDPTAFSHIIMIGPSPRYINDEGYTGGFEQEQMEQLLDMMDSNYLGWSGMVAPMIMANADRPELGEELNSNFCATEPSIARQFARVTFFSDNRTDVPRLDVNTLIMQCSEDIIAPESVGHYLHTHLPESSFVQLNATGHCPHLSHPDEVIKAIRAFLAN